MFHRFVKKFLVTSLLTLTATPSLADWSYYTGALQQRQDTEQWCWASVARAVLKHNKNIEREQCRLASQWVAGKGYTDYCCTGRNSSWGRPIPSTDRTAECVKPFNLSSVLGEFGAYETFVDHPTDPNGVSGVEKQLQENTPPVAVVSWGNGTAHAITIVSGTNSNNQTQYEIYDPWTGRGWITRNNLKVYKTTGKWTGTIHTK
jgi:hypothetical protein